MGAGRPATVIGLDPITPPKGITEARATASTLGRLVTRSICSRRVSVVRRPSAFHRLDLIGIQAAATSGKHVDAGRVGGAGDDDIVRIEPQVEGDKRHEAAQEQPGGGQETRARATCPVASTACPRFASRCPKPPAAGGLASLSVRTRSARAQASAGAAPKRRPAPIDKAVAKASTVPSTPDLVEFGHASRNHRGRGADDPGGHGEAQRTAGEAEDDALGE